MSKGSGKQRQADLEWKYRELLNFTRKTARREWLNTSGTAAKVLQEIGEDSRPERRAEVLWAEWQYTVVALAQGRGSAADEDETRIRLTEYVDNNGLAGGDYDPRGA